MLTLLVSANTCQIIATHIYYISVVLLLTSIFSWMKHTHQIAKTKQKEKLVTLKILSFKPVCLITLVDFFDYAIKAAKSDLKATNTVPFCELIEPKVMPIEAVACALARFPRMINTKPKQEHWAPPS